MLRNKKAAMEMSVGTIVTIVLLMTVLVLGLVLVTNIFKSAEGVIDLTDQQLREEVNKLFSEQKKLVIYPGTRFLEIEQGEIDGFGIGIKNLLTGEAGIKKFSYQVEVSDPDLRTKCGINVNEVERWITTGRQEVNLAIPVGDLTTQKVLFDVPVGSPLCTVRFRVNVNVENTPYATDFFDIKIIS